MAAGTFLRKLLATRDERGRVTSDRFRLAVRKAVRGLTVGVTGRILDAGGADGLLFDPNASSLADNVTVLDLDLDSLKTGRRSYGKRGRFVCGDMTRMPFDDGVFAATACIGTFYNFPTADLVRQGIGEMARVTDPGGTIILEFRNAGNPVVSLAYRYAESYDPSLDGLTLKAYTVEEVTDVLMSLGLVIERIRYVGIPLRRLAIGFIVVARKKNGE